MNQLSTLLATKQNNNKPQKTAKITAVIIGLLLFSSCEKTTSNKYITAENEAINDIILEMTKFDEMKNLIDTKNKKLILYLDAVLDTTTALTYKPELPLNDIETNNLSLKEIEQIKINFVQDSIEYEREKSLFMNLKNDEIKKRTIDYAFKNEKLDIKYFDAEKVEEFDTNENELGYLFVSRIVFNKEYTKGYLHFDFICGDGCAWDYNIEIKKENGKWKISEYFSGGES